MFTDIFFIILIIVGIVASIPAAIFIIAGLIKKARATIIIGLFLALCSLFCFGFNYWYYNIHIPGIQNQEEQKDSTQFEMNENEILRGQVRSALSGIFGSVELLQGGLDSPEKKDSLLSIIDKSARTINGYVSETV